MHARVTPFRHPSQPQSLVHSKSRTRQTCVACATNGCIASHGLVWDRTGCDRTPSRRPHEAAVQFDPTSSVHVSFLVLCSFHVLFSLFASTARRPFVWCSWPSVLLLHTRRNSVCSIASGCALGHFVVFVDGLEARQAHPHRLLHVEEDAAAPLDAEEPRVRAHAWKPDVSRNGSDGHGTAVGEDCHA